MTSPILALIALFAAVLALWFISLSVKDSSIADIFWAPGFAIVGWVSAIARPNFGPRAELVLVLASVWAMRLGLHILKRHTVEDHRYATMRTKFGPRWWWLSLFQVFLLQGALIWIISLPLQFAIGSPAALNGVDFVGAALVLAGVVVEAIADSQLARFRSVAANRGRVMDTGLWSWSRHPNYFGDALIWWGFYAIAISASPSTWWTVISPIVMTVLLLRVSGVSLLEQNIVARRPAYEDYMRRTSAFVPWPPKRQ